MHESWKRTLQNSNYRSRFVEQVDYSSIVGLPYFLQQMHFLHGLRFVLQVGLIHGEHLRSAKRTLGQPSVQASGELMPIVGRGFVGFNETARLFRLDLTTLDDERLEEIVDVLEPQSQPTVASKNIAPDCTWMNGSSASSGRERGPGRGVRTTRISQTRRGSLPRY